MTATDTTYKCNLILQGSRSYTSNGFWKNDQPPILIYPFATIGAEVIKTGKIRKIHDQRTLACFLGHSENHMILVEDDQRRKHHIEMTDFTPHHSLIDSKLIFAKAYKARKRQKVPEVINIVTLAPTSYNTGHRHPDDT